MRSRVSASASTISTGRNPALVYCSATGFGWAGPLRDEPCTDPHMQAFSGFAAGNAGADGRPPAHPLLRIHGSRHLGDHRRGSVCRPSSCGPRRAAPCTSKRRCCTRRWRLKPPFARTRMPRTGVRDGEDTSAHVSIRRRVARSRRSPAVRPAARERPVPGARRPPESSRGALRSARQGARARAFGRLGAGDRPAAVFPARGFSTMTRCSTARGTGISASCGISRCPEPPTSSPAGLPGCSAALFPAPTAPAPGGDTDALRAGPATFWRAR